jgi:hypothetical protein
VDTLAAAVGPEVRQAILGRTLQLPQRAVKQLAHLAQDQPTVAAEVVSAAQAAKTPGQAVQAVNRGLTHVRMVPMRAKSEEGQPAWLNGLASCSWWEEYRQHFTVSTQQLAARWEQFCAEEGLTLTPPDAEAGHRARFAAWLEAMAEEQERVFAANRERHRQSYFEELCVHLHELIEEYGVDLVWAEIGQPVFAGKIAAVAPQGAPSTSPQESAVMEPVPRQPKGGNRGIAPEVLAAIRAERHKLPALSYEKFARHLFKEGIYQTVSGGPASAASVYKWLREGVS